MKKVLIYYGVVYFYAISLSGMTEDQVVDTIYRNVLELRTAQQNSCVEKSSTALFAITNAQPVYKAFRDRLLFVAQIIAPLQIPEHEKNIQIPFIADLMKFFLESHYERFSERCLQADNLNLDTMYDYVADANSGTRLSGRDDNFGYIVACHEAGHAYVNMASFGRLSVRILSLKARELVVEQDGRKRTVICSGNTTIMSNDNGIYPEKNNKTYEDIIAYCYGGGIAEQVCAQEILQKSSYAEYIITSLISWWKSFMISNDYSVSNQTARLTNFYANQHCHGDIKKIETYAADYCDEFILPPGSDEQQIDEIALKKK